MNVKYFSVLGKKEETALHCWSYLLPTAVVGVG